MNANTITTTGSCLHVMHRLWKRKHFVFLSIVLVSLVITVAYSGVNLSSIFTRNAPRDPYDAGGKISAYRLKKARDLEDNLHRLKAFESNRHENDLQVVINNNNGEIVGEKPKKAASGHYIPPRRFVHLDLKGAPPKLSYLSQIFPLLESAGANGLLLEFEDTFPFTGILKDSVVDNAYTKQDISQLIELAERHNFELIPLIQTFGHLEYFLKLPHYRHLREHDEYPQAICPSRNESLVLIEEIVDQVVAMFPKSKWLHIGCDEVFQLGMCELCQYVDREELFLAHVKRVSSYVRSKHNVAPIIWDDMLRTISMDKIQHFDFQKIGVEIMVWTYIDDIYRFIPQSQFEFLGTVFNNLWGASAFKGAFGETLTVPNIKMHLDNNIAWLQALQEQQANFKKVHGIVITGWQRYDHLANLCELLPSGLPSLILDLLTVSYGKYDQSVYNRFDQLMKCDRSYYTFQNILFNDENFFSKVNCKFPGVGVFRTMERLASVQKRVDDYLYDKTIHKAWITDYNVRHNISSPFRIDEALKDFNSIWYDLKNLQRGCLASFKDVYDDFTTYEWIEQKIYPSFVRMEKFFNDTIELKKARVWPKRPINSLNVIKRYLDTETTSPYYGSK